MWFSSGGALDRSCFLETVAAVGMAGRLQGTGPLAFARASYDYLKALKPAKSR
jgi:hypothetical protein